MLTAWCMRISYCNSSFKSLRACFMLYGNEVKRMTVLQERHFQTAEMTSTVLEELQHVYRPVYQSLIHFYYHVLPSEARKQRKTPLASVNVTHKSTGCVAVPNLRPAWAMITDLFSGFWLWEGFAHAPNQRATIVKPWNWARAERNNNNAGVVHTVEQAQVPLWLYLISLGEHHSIHRHHAPSWDICKLLLLSNRLQSYD